MPAPALSVRDLRKTYDNGVQALKGVSLDVAPGDFYALLGPNGAGKSTLIGIVSSLVNKSAGDVRIFGVDIGADRDAAMRLIGLVPQELNFNMFEKPLDILVNYAGFYGIPRAEALQRAEEELKRAQLWDKADKMSRTLSGGMKRRLMIARAMMTRPRLLILDEPTAGVDIEIRRGMWKTLKEINASGTTIILTTHYLEEAESLCRNLAIIDRGHIVQQGPMKALLAMLDIEGFLFDIDGTLPATLPGDRGHHPARRRRPHPRPRHAARDGPQPRVRRAGRRRHPRALDAHQEQPAGGTVRAPDRRRRGGQAGAGGMNELDRSRNATWSRCARSCAARSTASCASGARPWCRRRSP